MHTNVKLIRFPKIVLTIVLLFFVNEINAQCNVKYVSPGATGVGTMADPGDLESIVASAIPTDLIRLDTGAYTISNAINIPTGITIEGGFIQALGWTKTSLAGASRIIRDNLNPEGALGFDRLVAFYGNTVSNFSIRDVQIETLSANGNSRTTYGVHLTDCSDYTFSRAIIIAGAGSDGVNGIDGADGASGTSGLNGLNGDNDDEASPGHGGRGGNGGGAGAGLGGNGGVDGGGCCFVGPPGQIGNISLNSRAGGGGGGGGCGGEDDNGGGNGGGRGGVFAVYASGGPVGAGGGPGGGDPGDDGENGTVGLDGLDGVNGVAAVAGSYLTGFYVPEGGTDGTDGTGGTGGSGGGGGAGQDCTFCIDGAGNGGGGGGGGGQGGQLGTGGTGGGGSFGVYLYNNGANGAFVQCNISAGPASLGGAGGDGGSFGFGALRGNGGTAFLFDIGRGGNGGNGGDGGIGGDGGDGADGTALIVRQDGGSSPISSDYSFDLASQPEIRMANEICAFDSVEFSAAISGTWDFGLDALPATGTGITIVTHYQDTGRFDVDYNGNVYNEFAYISPFSTDTADAGLDAEFCEDEIGLSLLANIPQWGTGTWSSLGAATVDSPTLYNSTISDLVVGENLFVWTISSDCCPDRTDTMSIIILPHSTSTFDITECGDYVVPSGDETYTAVGTYVVMDTIPNAEGCDSIMTINLTILADDAISDVITACDSYTWTDGITYTADEFAASQTFTNEAGCDSVVTLNLTINYSNTGIDVIAACDSYTWIDGVTYTADEFAATETLTNAAGCDSVVTLNLTINESNTGIDVITACDSYTWIDGNTYTADEFAATETVTNAAGCDSVVTLNLTINESTVGTDIITACDSYTWIDGITYTADEFAATQTLTNAAGCDSVVTLNLTINNSTTGIDVITACDSYMWIDGATYIADEFAATYTLTNALGCDSVVTLNLTMNYSNTGIDVITACDTYTWIDGVTYTADEFAATETLTNAAGCDSVVTLNLTINESNTGIDVITACDSYTWIDGNTYTADEFAATETVTNAAGCDSVVTLNLTINESTVGTDVITACESYTWIDGITYTADEFAATQTLTNAVGCDSVVTLNLTINNSTTGIDVITACDTYTWIDGATYTADEFAATHTLTNALGCDSVVTLNLTMNYSNTGTDVITACDTYTWIDGVTYTADEFAATETLTNAAGCDSVVTLNLTINESNTGIDAITACDSYTWIDGNTYTADEFAATQTLTNAAGCDSVVTLNLTINESNTGIDIISACDSYTWIDGITYTSDEFAATQTLTNIAGCDSVVTLNLTINTANTGTDIVTACDSFTWIDGMTYTADEFAATHTLTNIAGCDSVVTLNLTMNYSTTGTDVITACDSYTWIDGETYTADEFAATHTLTNEVGCDSVITLNLTINNSTTGIDIITACDSYTWLDGVTYTADEFAATHILTNEVGCDSIVTLNLTINNSAATIDVIEACESYTWTDGVTYTADEFSASQTLTTVDGCDSIVTLNLTINPLPTVGATASSLIICFGESVTLNGTGALTYTWDGGVINGIPFTPGVIGTTVYTVTGTSSEGCESTATIDILVNDCDPVIPDFEFVGAPCVGNCIQINDLSIGGPVTDWFWDFGGAVDPGTSTEQHPEICLTDAGVYTIELTTTNINGSTYSSTQSITIYNRPTIETRLDTIIDLGGTADLIAIASWEGDYHWTPIKTVDCPTCPITSAKPIENETYTVIFTDQNGCKVSDTVMVLVNFKEGIGVPTAFSPNGDGVNDVLYVKGYGIESLYFVVYNRYGELIFKSTDQNIGWDGTFLEREENPGVFTWVIQYHLIDGKSGKQSGTTTLIR